MLNSEPQRPWRRAIPTLAERAAELQRTEREFRQHARRELGVTLGGMVVCCAGGLGLMGWALHTTNSGISGIAFLAGPFVGQGGSLILLLRHYARGEDR